MRNLGLGDLGFLGAVGGVAYDADALAYMTAVEAADGQALEVAVKNAIDAFVRGCKTDGIWTAIKASCILAGARTLAGALVPLVGTAPTNVGPFVAGDYNRKTGLAGDGSTKYLNSNRTANADPLASNHLSIYKTNTGNSGTYIGTVTGGQDYIDYFTQFRFFSRNTGVSSGASLSTVGLIGLSRNAGGLTGRIANSSASLTSSASPNNAATGSLFIFNRSGGNYLSSARLAFYSIGESLDLALLDARVTTLINALAAAIP